eukprot:CAMPEP_0177600770 /NCGR_PEP_ID=MMETSP0419_2-20121207/13857_1 /TAXON_ID=582737 /ORGANISM="Tetraselmis sp., Strain GSL018" /LENGTH=262 /DNA_ID=CAMNT_0019093899 /DNA_START=13 /DNA_END=803 /DNA_ORIENTATION=-
MACLQAATPSVPDRMGGAAFAVERSGRRGGSGRNDHRRYRDPPSFAHSSLKPFTNPLSKYRGVNRSQAPLTVPSRVGVAPSELRPRPWVGESLLGPRLQAGHERGKHVLLLQALAALARTVRNECNVHAFVRGREGGVDPRSKEALNLGLEFFPRVLRHLLRLEFENKGICTLNDFLSQPNKCRGLAARKTVGPTKLKDACKGLIQMLLVPVPVTGGVFSYLLLDGCHLRRAELEAASVDLQSTGFSSAYFSARPIKDIGNP